MLTSATVVYINLLHLQLQPLHTSAISKINCRMMSARRFEIKQLCKVLGWCFQGNTLMAIITVMLQERWEIPEAQIKLKWFWYNRCVSLCLEIPQTICCSSQGLHRASPGFVCLSISVQITAAMWRVVVRGVDIIYSLLLLSFTLVTILAQVQSTMMFLSIVIVQRL